MKKLIFAVTVFFLLGGLVMLVNSVPPLEAGDGQAIMEARCTTCHGAGRIQAAGHTEAVWQETVSRMMEKGNFGPALSDAERELLITYLTTLK